MTTETIVAFLQTYNGVMLLATAVAIIAMEWAGRKGKPAAYLLRIRQKGRYQLRYTVDSCWGNFS